MVNVNVFINYNITFNTIMINNRKILSALIDHCNSKAYFSKITVIIDKLDKIGVDKVIQELQESIPNKECSLLFKELFNVNYSDTNMFSWLENKLENSDEGQKGLKELNHIVNLSNELAINSSKKVKKLDENSAPFILQGLLDFYHKKNTWYNIVKGL